MRLDHTQRMPWSGCRETGYVVEVAVLPGDLLALSVGALAEAPVDCHHLGVLQWLVVATKLDQASTFHFAEVVATEVIGLMCGLVLHPREMAVLSHDFQTALEEDELVVGEGCLL